MNESAQARQRALDLFSAGRDPEWRNRLIWGDQGDTFHNEWQTYRTRKARDLQLSAAHTYDAPGEYTIVVKVIDILGNDTTKTMRVKVG